MFKIFSPKKKKVPATTWHMHQHIVLSNCIQSYYKKKKKKMLASSKNSACT